MARNNIQFKGIRHSPSDITGQDGDLLECVNLIHENGELKPIEMPERTSINMGSGYVLAAIHNVVGEKLFVGVSVSGGDTVVKAVSENGSPVLISSANSKTVTGETFAWSETIGNTLVIGTDKSTHYAIYKNNEYKWLGDKLPQPVFKFDFDRSAVNEEAYYISVYEPNTYTLDPNGDPHGGGGVLLDGYLHNAPNDTVSLANTTEENKLIFRDGVRSKVEKALGIARMHNRFVFPFFVRYAVRMFDNSYAMHSAPILMVPSTLSNPILAFLQYNGDIHGYEHEQMRECWVAFDVIRLKPLGLTMSCTGFVDESGNPVNNVTDWSDIIKGVDIFLSSQVRTYDERGWDDLNRVQTTFSSFMKAENGNFTERDYGHCYTKNKKLGWFDIYDKSLGHGGTNGVIDPDETVDIRTSLDDPVLAETGLKYLKIELPSANASLVQEKIENTSLFYRVKQYDLEDVVNWNSESRYFHAEVEDGTLDKLETLTLLPDDYVSRCRMVGKANYNYNQRLLLGNLQLQAPHWYQDAKTFPNDTGAKYNIYVCFKIEKQDKTIYVRWNKDNLGANDFGHYLYYPDPDCKEAIVIAGANSAVIQMQEHTGLNGAYALMPNLKSLYTAIHDDDFPSFIGTLPSESLDRYYSLPNTVAMSSVANPFHFEATNFQDLGRTKVIGIATNTLDVSYNQWGPYSVIVFCSDGIVTVPIDKKGNFTGEVEAISADVLREPQGYSQPTLAQTGQALVFLTQRGVMMIAGTRINCVSEAMNGKHFNPLTELTPANSVLYGVGAFSSLVSETSDTTDFKMFAASGFLAYDYAHDRVLLLNGLKDYQYVLNLKTWLWSKQVSYTNLASIQVDEVPGPDVRSLPTLTVVPMKAAVNNYTEMYLQDTNGYLYKTMEVANENVQNSLYQYGYFISRPIRFGTDEYKTITRMLNRYTHYAANSFARVALYGSRDGVRYGRVNTLRGMSYQYYIFVAYTYLKPNERYSYLSVDFDTRLTNKLR